MIESVIELFINKIIIPNFYKAKLKYKEFGLTFNQIKV